MVSSEDVRVVSSASSRPSNAGIGVFAPSIQPHGRESEGGNASVFLLAARDASLASEYSRVSVFVFVFVFGHGMHAYGRSFHLVDEVFELEKDARASTGRTQSHRDRDKRGERRSLRGAPSHDTCLAGLDCPYSKAWADGMGMVGLFVFVLGLASGGM